MATKEIWFQHSGIKRSRRCKQMEWEKRIRTTAFIPSPPLSPGATKNIARELRGAQCVIRACLPGTHRPLGDKAAKFKACCRLPVLQPEPLPIGIAGKQSRCSEERAHACATGQRHFGYRPADSRTTLHPGSAQSRRQKEREFVAWEKDAERAWAAVLAGAADISPALCMKSSS